MMKGPRFQPPNRPHTCCYWVTDMLLAGEYPTCRHGEQGTRNKLRAYLDCGITCFLDLTQPGEKHEYEFILQDEAFRKGIVAPIVHQRHPIQDFSIPTRERMKEILDAIDEAIDNNQKVYVHCRGGIGRTGTVIGCYFVRHGNSGPEALKETNRLFQNSDRSRRSHPKAPETAEQERFVLEWSEGEGVP